MKGDDGVGGGVKVKIGLGGGKKLSKMGWLGESPFKGVTEWGGGAKKKIWSRGGPNFSRALLFFIFP